MYYVYVCVVFSALVVIVGADMQLTFAVCSVMEGFEQVINHR